jgi:hypothetical protein
MLEMKVLQAGAHQSHVVQLHHAQVFQRVQRRDGAADVVAADIDVRKTRPCAQSPTGWCLRTAFAEQAERPPQGDLPVRSLHVKEAVKKKGGKVDYDEL